MKAERGFMLGSGIWERAGKVFRIAHMGLQSTDSYLLPCRLGIEEYLRTKGHDVRTWASPVALEY